MVYQEDVIKLRLHYGGLTAAYGDILRRAISVKRTLAELQSVKSILFCSQRHPRKLSEEVQTNRKLCTYSFVKRILASYRKLPKLIFKTYYGIEL
jgi:DNA polymerase III alpha subunit